MRNILIILLLLLFWSCTSCNGNNPKNDQDSTVSTDYDTVSDTDQQDEKADNDSLDNEVDEDTDDNEELADVDYQGAEDCPELAKAKFPYYNNDKSIHFCRECDKPTVKDPQCVENLWKDAAAALYAVSPESECEKGYPCEMPELKPRTQAEWDEAVSDHPLPYRPHECDFVLTTRSPNGRWATDSTVGAIKHFDISDGKVGIKLMNVNQEISSYTTESKVMVFDPSKKYYKAVAPFVGDMLSYHKGCFIYMSADLRTSDLMKNNRYLLYSCEDGKRAIAYPDKIEFVSYTPALSEKWAVVNIEPKEGGGSSTMYAKVGEWKWTKLMDGLSFYPQIVNDRVVFHDSNSDGYYCDLSKNPKSLKECIKINRENESLRFTVINENNETEVVYESRIGSELTITKIVITSEGKKTYSVIESTFSETDSYWIKFGYTPENYRDGFIFYTESYVTNESGDWNGNHCFYNIEKKKRTCMKKLKDFFFKTNPNLGYGEWEGKWIVYQFLSGTTQCVRDLDCYCEKEGVCPFKE